MKKCFNKQNDLFDLLINCIIKIITYIIKQFISFIIIKLQLFKTKVWKIYLKSMSEQAQQQPVVQQPPEKSAQQLQQQRKQREEQQRLKQQQRKRLQEQARVKMQEDIKKLDQAIKGALSGLAKTHNNQTMAYIKLALAQKQLQRVFPSILRYQQIQYLDISTNAISNPQVLLQFPHLISLNISKNQISSLEQFSQDSVLTQLQILNLSTNKIKNLSNIALKSLRRLNLTQNQITEISWRGHNELQILELRKNKLKKLKGLKDIKMLKELYVCQNQITDVRGLENVPSLKKISLRNNKLKTFMNPFPHLPALQYLNMRQNQISSIAQLKKIPIHIRQINLLANPLTQQLGQNLKKEIIWQLPHFIKLNKSQVTPQQRLQFDKEWQEKQAERQRLQRQKQLQRQRQQQEKRRLAEQAGGNKQQA